jgi:hypothetical protein
VVILATVHVQSAARTAANQRHNAGKLVDLQQRHSGHQVTGVQAHVEVRKHKQQQADIHPRRLHLIRVLPAALCCIVAVATGWLAATQHVSVQSTIQQQQQQQHGDAGYAAPSTALVLAACSTAVLAPVMYCVLMQLLPSCFSVGEGALMAQGAAALAAAAILVVPEAPVFVPGTICQLLPGAALQLLLQLGGCSSAARSRALSLEALPAAILLVVTSTLLLCLLLRTGLAIVRGRSSSNHTSESPAHKAAPATSRSSWLGRLLLAAPVAALMATLLLWLVAAAVWTLLEFLPARQGRLLVLLYWVGLLGVTLPALGLWASHSKMPQVNRLPALQPSQHCSQASYMTGVRAVLESMACILSALVASGMVSGSVDALHVTFD